MMCVALAEEVALLLNRREETIAVAESCTGGLLAHCLTNIPGSSAYFRRGWVVYSNEAKTAELGVPSALIAAHGAVSAEVAASMAGGARWHDGSTYALAITGIAGPGGGTPEKPVGTTYIALAGPAGTKVQKHVFVGERLEVKASAVKAALWLLKKELLAQN
ncbi:MAG TPA: CinA family protein [Firmicutes bacterium]|nr:CinA family protein [Bacillota bacterium]